MTAADAATLLRTYADALKATHPVPADQTDLVGLIFDVDEESLPALDLSLHDSPTPRRMGVRAAVSLGLAAALALLIGYALLKDDSDVRTAGIPDGGGSGFVFEGETVIREDPLVVLAARPPEPTFDTSELGRRVIYEPIDLTDEAIDASIDELITRFETPIPPTLVTPQIRKISLLWSGEQRPKAIEVIDWTSDITISGTPPGSPVRVRGGNLGVTIDTNDPTASFRPPRTLSQLREDQGSETPRFIGGLSTGVGGSMELEASLDVAVLQLIVDGESMWAVPIDGIAVFPTNLRDDSSIEIAAYDSNGEEVARSTTTMAEL